MSPAHVRTVYRLARVNVAARRRAEALPAKAGALQADAEYQELIARSGRLWHNLPDNVRAAIQNPNGKGGR